jgi:hypothetical protein
MYTPERISNYDKYNNYIKTCEKYDDYLSEDINLYNLKTQLYNTSQTESDFDYYNGLMNLNNNISKIFDNINNNLYNTKTWDLTEEIKKNNCVGDICKKKVNLYSDKKSIEGFITDDIDVRKIANNIVDKTGDSLNGTGDKLFNLTKSVGNAGINSTKDKFYENTPFPLFGANPEFRRSDYIRNNAEGSLDSDYIRKDTENKLKNNIFYTYLLLILIILLVAIFLFIYL